jgi:mono/diheme cytochrome c family protein
LLASKSLPSSIRLLATSLIVLAVSQASAEDTPVSKGERLYDKNCSQCHGDNLQNNSGVAFDLRRLHLDEYSRFVDSVLHGKRAMPSWEGALTPEQIQNIWAYVRANAYQQ